MKSIILITSVAAIRHFRVSLRLLDLSGLLTVGVALGISFMLVLVIFYGTASKGRFKGFGDWWNAEGIPAMMITCSLVILLVFN